MAGEPHKAPRREEPLPRIPGYEILGFVGRGSSGVVFRARQLAVDREVAIKILHPHLARESRVVRRLQREARTTARLAHPHIVSAVDMGEVDGRWWYAMEFVDGPSLSQRLRAEGRIREREALRLFIPLCEALEHLAEHGVVHRDIKPANILIDKAGGARLADLGLAVTEEDPSITGTGGTLGTPHYISPEQAIDPRKVDTRSDIWSFGATLFHAVCGRPPFSGESAAEVLSGVLYWPIPDPEELEPTLSSRLALVLRKCLSRDPARRYQDPHELLLDLERVRERRAPKVQRRQLDPVQHRRDNSRRVALLSTGAVVAVLGALIFLVPRFLGPPKASASTPEEGSGPFEPLFELGERYRNGHAKPAEVLGELQGMGARVPVRERVYYEELVRAVDTDLRRAVRDARTALDARLDESIRAGDLDTGWRIVMDELEGRFVEATGYGLAGLASVGIQLQAWRERAVLNLESATDEAVSEFEEVLLEWRSRRLAQVENALAQQEWQLAMEALKLPSPHVILAQAGYQVKLPAVSQAGLFDNLAVDFRLRLERLQDDWQALDRELKNFVLTRRDTLERQLRETRPRPAAAALLRSDFEREIFDRNLTRDAMPNGLSRAGLEELESSARSLSDLERHLLEADAREDYADTEELADDALHRREYARALSLWNELGGRMQDSLRREPSVALAEIARRIEVRICEATRLDELLERASQRVHELDGRWIELRWGSILYPNVRLEAGPDPRRDGFRTDKIAGLLRLVDLPSQQLETFAGLGTEAELEPNERLMLAAFRLRDGRPQDAQRALFAGPTASEELEQLLADDLRVRIAQAQEQSEQRAGERESEAKQLLAEVLDEGYLRHSPRKAAARIERLLGELGDIPAVHQKKTELLRARARLEERAPGDEQREFELAFQPGEFRLPGPARAWLGYDFNEGNLGAWNAGDWLYDGLGFVLGPRTPIQGWDQLASERGMSLILKTPLVLDRLDLTLRFEALQGEAPGRLLWVTVGDFQVALGAADLPGAGDGARFLLGTDEPRVFLQRLLGGAGRREEVPLVPGAPPRELRIKASGRSGRCEVTLDGLRLADTSGLRVPSSKTYALHLRSWGSVRVLSASIEGGR